jgi:guanylate kinase
MTADSPGTSNPRSGLIFIVSAPSGAGKTSLIAQLLTQDANLVVSVSHTTRKRRSSETDGANYHFVDARTFRQMIADDAFVEHAEVFGNQYGTSKAALGAQLDRGRDVVLEIDWQGAERIRKAFPRAISIFILPPSREALTRRLQGRGQDDPAAIAERTRQAQLEMAHYADYDYLIVNDDFDTALDELDCVVKAARLGTVPQQEGLKTLLAELLKDT